MLAHEFRSLMEYAREHIPWTFVLAVVGALTVLFKAYSFFIMFLQTFVISGRSLKKWGARRGAYAVITGATDGIGREFALQLAKAGFGVVLVSRNPERLQNLANEITAQYDVDAKVQTLDFSRHDQAHAYEALAQQLQNLEVGVLVNNVGRSHDIPVYFDQTPQKEIDDILQINIHGTLAITKLVMPFMLIKKKGLILNIGSFAGEVPSPMLATYSGSKAFLAAWSRALAEEYHCKGIIVQLVNTFFVVSAMSKIRRPSITTPTPKAYVKSVLGHLQLPCGSVGQPFTTTPYWSHAVVEWLINVLNWPGILISYTHGLHINIRHRALKKREREGAKME